MSVLSHRFQRHVHVAVVCLLCMVMFVACGRTRPVSSPPVPGSLPPISEVSPGEAELMPQAGQARNIRRIHNRLLQEAQHHFQSNDFPQAIHELKRLVALNPQADLEREGHWWLGQSYDKLEDWTAAQGEYRLLASAPIGQRYQSNSSQRLHEIQGLLEERELPPLPTQAIRFALHQLPGANGFEQGITKMKQDGATTLLIDLGCQRVPLNHLSGKGAESIPDVRQLQGLLRSYAERSHHVGLLLYVGVNLRCLGNWAPFKHKAWQDQVYHLDTGRVSPNKQFDLFHPTYQEFLARFLAQLCKEEVDGLVLLNDHPLGLFEGVTPIGVKRFEQQFGVAFDPSQVFYQGFEPLKKTNHTQGLSRTKDTRAKDSLFWRWAGWKARERLTLLEGLVDRLRSQYPSVQIGLELHPHGLTDPVGALVTYAEDSMDAAGRSFSFFFVRPEIDRRSTFTEEAVIAKLRRISLKGVLDRLLPVVDDPRRVWVSLPAKGGQRLRPQSAGSAVSPLQDFPSGIGVVHDLRAFS